jgi:2',3'-cyclic-nucleotide 2'-phosphodiesterase (5'-nucleotidase family)
MPSNKLRKCLKNLFILTCFFNLTSAADAQVNLQFLGRYSTGFYNAAGAEISAYDPATKRMFVTNGPDTSMKIVSLVEPTNPMLVSSISIKPYGIDLTSIAVKNGIVAVAVFDSLGKTENGKVVFFNANGTYINQVDVGPNPDMLTFTPDGKKILVANEGEPNVGYTIDPEGSVSIIDISNGVASLTQSNVSTATFTQFNNTSLDWRIKLTGRIQSGGNFLRNSTVAEDLEPEYIAISDDGTTAWVTCQENNCLAELNINTGTFTRLIPLGFKNHSLAGNGMDASDNGTTINIANYPVFGMYQPDAIQSFKVGNTTYLVTANEGDARADWGAANVEEIRFGNAGYVVDTAKFGGAANVAALKANTALGRLNVTNRYGDFNNDGKFDSIFCFGARSFSIWNGTTGQLVWDSKDQFEQRISTLFPSNFNASNSNNTLKNRSDDKGPEPEAITVGKILDSVYAFIGLERIGGVMVYNITNPTNPYFVSYLNTRNFSQTPGLNAGGDLGPEGLMFIPGKESPNGKDMLLVSNEISGTVIALQVNSRSDFQMQILHSSDMESNISAVTDAPNFAAITDKLEDEYPNTLILSSGDNTLPGPFLSSGEDPSLQNPLRNTGAFYFTGGAGQLRAAIGRPDIAIMNIIGYNASALGNHEFDLGTTELNSQIGVDIRNNGTDKRWIGAQFPYISCNLNFSQDANLSYLYTNQILRDTAFKTPANITANAQKRGIAPSVVIERNGQKIGLVGITTQILAKISSPGATSVVGPQVDDMPALAAIMQPFIDSLRTKEGINKIIVLSHLQQLSNEIALAPLLKGVDIIIAGGNHQLLADGNDRIRPGQAVFGTYPIRAQNNDGDPLLILNSSAEWRYVNRLVVDFDNQGKLILNSLDSTVNGVYAADTVMVTALYGDYATAFASGTKGAHVRTLCAAIGAVINNKDGNVLGRANVFLEGRRNLVRTEETNLGNLSADANLWYAKQYDPQVRISLKNGGGIRSAIGNVNAVGSNVTLEPNQANLSASKPAGAISQLDVEGSLRFNNSLVIVSTHAAGLRRLLEHGISATRPGQTPGQFPQVGGISFSYDTTLTLGSRIRSLVITDSLGNRQDTIVRDGQLFGDTSRVYKIVTLNFLANPSGVGSPVGGDGYPFPSNISARVNLDTAIKASGPSSFASIGSEQDAFAEYLLARHNSVATAFAVRDTNLFGDRRIQLLNTRTEGIFPETAPAISILAARNLAQPNIVRVRGIVSRAWGRFIYIQDATGGIGVRQSSGAMVDAISGGTLVAGDSVEVIGPRNDFNNYAQIQLTTGAYTSTSTVVKLGSGKKVTPIKLTIKQFLANPEAHESELVKITGLRISGTGNFTASTNYNVWDGNTTGDTLVLRVIAAADTELDDAPATALPKDTFTFEGIPAQFCSSPSNGCTSGYQLYAIRKSDIMVKPGFFGLANPANNSVVLTSSDNASDVLINWHKSANSTRYRWVADVLGGNYTPGIVSFPSNNNGADTALLLKNNALDALLASLGVLEGSEITLKWTVFAYFGSDSVKASQDFNITLRRKLALKTFNLLSPVNNASITSEQGSNTQVNISFGDGNGSAYKWFLTTAAGSFENSLLVLSSNNNGADTNLTLTLGQIDVVLQSFGIKRGETVNLKWTVAAYLNGDTLAANQIWNINLTRGRLLKPFTLLGPANNARVEVKKNETSQVKINWSSAGSATNKYVWMLDLKNGSFASPLARINSDKGATDTVLTLTSGDIDALLEVNGVAEGDSIELSWTVRAYEAQDSLAAANAFGIKFVRKKSTSTSELSKQLIIAVYPNPSTGLVNFDSDNNLNEFSLTVTDVKGRLIYKGKATQSLDLSSENAGFYFLHFEGENGSSTFKLLLNK